LVVELSDQDVFHGKLRVMTKGEGLNTISQAVFKKSRNFRVFF